MPARSPCHHTLEDLQNLLTHMHEQGVYFPAILVALRVAASPAPGLPWASLTAAQRLSLTRRWPAHIHRTGEHVLPGDRFGHAIGLSADNTRHKAASLLRVLIAMETYGLTSTEIAFLAWASRPEGVNAQELPLLGWTHRAVKDPVRHKLKKLRLIHPRRDPGSPLAYHLTPAGKKLLLGHWGKATNAAAKRSAGTPARPDARSKSGAPSTSPRAYTNANAA